MISLGPKLFSSFWHTIPGILAFCLHLCPTWWPNAYHSSRPQGLTHDKKKGEGREGSKNGLSLGNLFISQWRGNVLRSPLMDFACYLIDQTCSHGLTSLQMVLGKQLFLASTLERGKDRNDIHMSKYVYECMRVYIHTYIHRCIYAVFFYRVRTTGAFAWVLGLVPCQLSKEIQAFIWS